ncbi:MAG: hypothetical protein ACP5J5_04555 [Dissulfurimicrobium sp.]|uniref:hypothetical protein n=1 Tax=Dissulfurimicrobium TaxID=1769732 RepID=UPI003C733452
MRCPGCGTISFDHHEVCKRCGTDLRGLKGLLWEGVSADESINWFELAYSAKRAIIENGGANQIKGQTRLVDIDVSDLVSDEFKPKKDEAVGLDPDLLKRAAANEEFQRRLNDIIEEN